LNYLNFQHPFSCKLIGNRGSGKTTWIINFINQCSHFYNFNSILWLSNTSNQTLLNFLQISVSYIEIFDISNLFNNNNSRLLICDDIMFDVKNNKHISKLYTTGRHFNISIFSLEQHTLYSNNIERGNTDYWLLFHCNDMTSLFGFANRYCNDIHFNIFKNRLIHCWNKGYPLIIFMNHSFKYRLNFHLIFLNDCIISNIHSNIDSTLPKKPKNKLLYNIFSLFLHLID
jgi:hypothetical protein